MRVIKEKTPYQEFHMTHQQIADAFGDVSRAAIGQIELRAMEKVRKEIEKRGYKMEDFLGAMR